MPAWSPVDLLPGVWFGVLAFLLQRGLRRFYDAVPVWVLGAFVLVLLPLFGPVLYGGKILLPLDGLRGEAPFRGVEPSDPPSNPIQGDLLQLVTPSLAAVREAYGEGRWPLWNPRVGAGMPLLADPQAQAGAPLVLLASPLPLWRAVGVIAALRVWIALVFGFLLLRRQGLHPGPALAGAFGFGLGGFLLLWLGWPLANTAALLPFLLYSLVRYDAEGGRRDQLLLALAIFSILLAGHPETIVYALALGLAFLLDRVRRRPAGRRRVLLLGVGLALALAAAAAAPLLLPTLRYLPQTLRAAHLRDPAPAAPSAAPGLAARLLPLAAPNAYGNSRFFSYWGRANTNEDASGFAGTAILLLVLLGLPGLLGGDAGRRLPQEGLLLGTAGAALVLLALAPGPAPLRLTLIFNFALAYLGACTLERWRTREVPPSRRPAHLTLLIVLVAAVLAVVLAWAYLGHPDPGDPGRLAILRFGWLRWQLRFLVATALLLVAGWRRRWMPPLVAVLVACELLLAHRSANPPSPARLVLPLNDPIHFLVDHLGQDRMAALGSAFPPNLASLYGLADARVYNPMAPRRYAEVTAPITRRFRGEIPEWGSPGDPLYGQLGVRYLLGGPAEGCPAPWTLALRDPAAVLCERADPLPRLSVPGGVPFDVQIPDADRLGARVPAGVSGASGRLLRSSVYQDGGWRMLAAGRRVAAAEVSGPFVGAPLPAGVAGAVTVDLLYRPPGFLRGCLLAALALALGTAVWCPPPRKALE
jgi:hypothetical protein